MWIHNPVTPQILIWSAIYGQFWNSSGQAEAHRLWSTWSTYKAGIYHHHLVFFWYKNVSSMLNSFIRKEKTDKQIQGRQQAETTDICICIQPRNSSQNSSLWSSLQFVKLSDEFVFSPHTRVMLQPISLNCEHLDCIKHRVTVRWWWQEFGSVWERKRETEF